MHGTSAAAGPLALADRIMPIVTVASRNKSMTMFNFRTAPGHRPNQQASIAMLKYVVVCFDCWSALYTQARVRVAGWAARSAPPINYF
jgi:hypothetical protein